MIYVNKLICINGKVSVLVEDKKIPLIAGYTILSQEAVSVRLVAVNDGMYLIIEDIESEVLHSIAYARENDE